MAKYNSISKSAQNLAREAVLERNILVEQLIEVTPTRYLDFRQEDSPMRVDGDDYPPKLMSNQEFRIYGVEGHWEDLFSTATGNEKISFQLQVSIDKVLQPLTIFVEDDFRDVGNQIGPFSKIFDIPVGEEIIYEAPSLITLRVIKSQNLKESEFTLLMTPLR